MAPGVCRTNFSSRAPLQVPPADITATGGARRGRTSGAGATSSRRGLLTMELFRSLTPKRCSFPAMGRKGMKGMKGMKGIKGMKGMKGMKEDGKAWREE